jgi:hypothetical protein
MVCQFTLETLNLSTSTITGANYTHTHCIGCISLKNLD